MPVRHVVMLVRTSLNDSKQLHKKESTHSIVNHTEELLRKLKMLCSRADKGASAAETVEVMCKLAHEFSRSDPDRAEGFADRALALSERQELKQGIAESYLALGTLNWAKGNFDRSLEYYFKSLKICNEIRYRKGAANCHSNIGIIRNIRGNFEGALKSQLNSLKIKEEISDYPGIAKSYNNIGIIYDERGQFEDALDYYRKALHLFEKIGDRLGIALSYNNIGIVHESKKEYTLALEYYKRSLKIKEEIGDRKGIAGATLNIGTLFEEQKEYDDALVYCRKALDIYINLGDKRGCADSNNWIGRISTRLKRYDSALTHLNEGLELALKIGAKAWVADSYQYLSELHQAQGNYEQALICYIKYNEQREKVFSDLSIEKMAKMQVRYETERKEKETEIYRDFFENTLVGMYRISPEGNILMANSTLVEMLGYSSSDELKRHNLRETESNSHHPPIVFDDHFKNDEVVHGLETIWFRRDCSSLHIWENYKAVRDESGNTQFFEGTVENITERKKNEKAKRELEREVQQIQRHESLEVLAGGIAHDFNNILMAILGNTDLAMREISPASRAHSNVKAIETAARRAADLVKQMLAYSGKGRFLIERFSLNDSIDEITHILEVSISKKALISYHFADNLPLIEADAGQIRQIIMNLVTNASDAIDRTGGLISITTGVMNCDSEYLANTYIDESLPAGQYVYVDVTDNGCGMDTEALGKLFNPFYTTKFTGRGLGLAAVLGIIRGHNGAIKVCSEPEKGTSVRVLFPACPGSGESEIKKKNGNTRNWTRPGIILLVDDEETILSVGKQMLEHLGFEVITALDGRHAIELFTKNLDDIVLVILDLIMPNIDGEETFRKLCEIKDDVAVILCSGYDEQEVTQRFKGKSLSGFLHKPYKFSELENTVKEALNESGRR